MSEIAYLTLNTNAATEGGPFTVHSPKADAIKAVKLTAENLNAVGAYILKALGGDVRVDEATNPIAGIHRKNVAGVEVFVAQVGDWLVEKYDYAFEHPVFVTASIAERQKYDLR